MSEIKFNHAEDDFFKSCGVTRNQWASIQLDIAEQYKKSGILISSKMVEYSEKLCTDKIALRIICMIAAKAIEKDYTDFIKSIGGDFTHIDFDLN